MEILFWLVPAAVATLVAMLWVGWWGRDGRGEVSRDEAARRLGKALSREQSSRPGYAVERRAPDRASGIAVRPSRARPVVLPGTVIEPPQVADAPPEAPAGEQAAPDRRAS